MDGKWCLLEWKTTSSRYPEEPDGLLALDPQLVCYSWITGIAEVAQVVFVRKRLVEVQYLRTTITDEQRQEFGYLVEETIRRIEAGHFMPHSGIRFPQNPCTTCSYIGLCLGRPELAQNRLVRRSEALQCILLCFCFCTSDKHSLWKEVARYPLNLDSHLYDGLLVFC